LNAPTGGSEKKAIPNDQDGEQPITTDAFAMPKNPNPTTLVTTETKVERDPQTGHILRIIRSDEDCEDATARKRQLNPLNDPLEDLSDQEESSAISTGPNGIVAELEALAEEEGAALARKRRPRQQSKREEEWIARLVGKHGDDIRAMARDVNLNPMQQSEGDLGRRIKKWKENKQMNDRPREL
jgi:nucleolar protein 16